MASRRHVAAAVLVVLVLITLTKPCQMKSLYKLAAMMGMHSIGAHILTMGLMSGYGGYGGYGGYSQPVPVAQPVPMPVHIHHLHHSTVFHHSGGAYGGLDFW